jgi:putative resolvase
VDNGTVVIYCRVSNHSRKKEIEYQIERCEEYCRAKGYSITKVYKEIASGMNDNRKQL